ncbi:MAG: VWA domain-containing protein, partial [Rhodospirillaceae bacterium]|nr:VWA domain-containing protein [Rhodospirillaceae bacterium]
AATIPDARAVLSAADVVVRWVAERPFEPRAWRSHDGRAAVGVVVAAPPPPPPVTPPPAPVPPTPAPLPGTASCSGLVNGAPAVEAVGPLGGAAAAAEIIFIIDRSGSMQGHKMDCVRGAMQVLLRSLPAGTRFNIISFGRCVRVEWHGMAWRGVTWHCSRLIPSHPAPFRKFVPSYFFLFFFEWLVLYCKKQRQSASARAASFA